MSLSVADKKPWVKRRSVKHSPVNGHTWMEATKVQTSVISCFVKKPWIRVRNRTSSVNWRGVNGTCANCTLQETEANCCKQCGQLSDYREFRSQDKQINIKAVCGTAQTPPKWPVPRTNLYLCKIIVWYVPVTDGVCSCACIECFPSMKLHTPTLILFSLPLWAFVQGHCKSGTGTRGTESQSGLAHSGTRRFSRILSSSAHLKASEHS